MMSDQALGSLRGPSPPDCHTHPHQQRVGAGLAIFGRSMAGGGLTGLGTELRRKQRPCGRLCLGLPSVTGRGTRHPAPGTRSYRGPLPCSGERSGALDLGLVWRVGHLWAFGETWPPAWACFLQRELTLSSQPPLAFSLKHKVAVYLVTSRQPREPALLLKPPS